MFSDVYSQPGIQLLSVVVVSSRQILLHVPRHLYSRIFSILGLHPSHLIKLASSRTFSMDPRLSRALRPSVVGKYRHCCIYFSTFCLNLLFSIRPQSSRLSTHCHLRQVALPGLPLWLPATRRAEVIVERSFVASAIMFMFTFSRTGWKLLWNMHLCRVQR